MEVSDGPSRSHVDRVGGCRSRQPVGRSASAESAARNGEPEGVRARSAPADQAVQSLEPRAYADRRGALLHRSREADPCRCCRSRARRVRRIHDAARRPDRVGPRCSWPSIIYSRFWRSSLRRFRSGRSAQSCRIGRSIFWKSTSMSRFDIGNSRRQQPDRGADRGNRPRGVRQPCVFEISRDAQIARRPLCTRLISYAPIQSPTLWRFKPGPDRICRAGAIAAHREQY